MSLQLLINYDDGADFTYDDDLIEIDTVGARLLLQNTLLSFTQLFADSSGFTYTAANVEFAAGLLRQKNQLPANAILGAKYATNINLTWATFATWTGVAVGAPEINNGRLACLDQENRAIKYTDASIGAIGSLGAIKFKYTPDYTSKPATQHSAMVQLRAPTGVNDLIEIHHLTSTGKICLSAWDSGGNSIHANQDLSASAWVAVAAQEYEFELNFNAVTGLISLYIDGNLYGSTPATAFTRGTSATVLQVGASSLFVNCDAYFDDVVLFSTVQHTANYVKGYTLPDYQYLADKVDLPIFTYSDVGDVQGLASFAITEVGVPKYTVNGQYFTTVWEDSDGSYAQANALADVVANIEDITATDTTSVSVIFANSSTLSSVDNLAVEYYGQSYPVTGPTILLASQTDMAGITDFTADATTTGLDQIKYILELNSVEKYFDSTTSTWVNSNGTYAQSNTAAEILANCTTLEMGVGYSTRLKTFLHSANGQTTPEISSNTIEYNFAAPIQAAINECVVWCALADIIQGDLSDYTECELCIENDDMIHSGRVFPAAVQKASFISNYTANLQVIETTTITKNLKFYITGKYLGQPFQIWFTDAYVPNIATANITAITAVTIKT